MPFPINVGNVVSGGDALPSGVPSTYFYYRAVGYLVPSASGLYTVGVNCADGCNLFIGSNALVSNVSGADTAHSTLDYTRSGQIALTKGLYYPLIIEWQHGSGANYELQLIWTPPSGSKALIPAANLSDNNGSVSSSLGVKWWAGTAGLWYPGGAGVADWGNTASLKNNPFATMTPDTDGTLAADSDTKIATQKAVKTYVDAAAFGGGGGGSGGNMHSGSGSPNGIVIHDYSGAGATSVGLPGVQSGDVIVLFVQFEGDISGASASDSLGTTYTRVFNSTGLSLNVAILVGVAPSTGSDTITWSPGGSFQRILAVAIGGLTGTVDAVTGAANSTTSASLSITTTGPGDLILCFGAGFHSADTFTAGVSWRNLIQGNASDANFAEYKYSSTAGSYTCTWSINNGADNSYIAAIALQPSSTSTPGSDGDFFIDTTAQGLYGPRSTGAYPLIGYLT